MDKILFKKNKFGWVSQFIKRIFLKLKKVSGNYICRGAGKSLARPTSKCILFDDENTSFHASLVIYIIISI